MINDKITQTDLNLAINYMVMERLTHCMRLDEYLCDEFDGTQHDDKENKENDDDLKYDDWLHIIFKRAANGTLRRELMELGQNNKDGLVSLFEKLHNIFGLDGEVLSGERQINLGIAVDPNESKAVSLSKISVEELRQYIDNHISTTGDKFDEMPWFNTGLACQIVNNALVEGIGEISTENSLTSKDAIKSMKDRWLCNPLGINTLGLFVYLAETNKISWSNIDVDEKKVPHWNGVAVSAEEIEGDKERKLYAQSFESIKYTPHNYSGRKWITKGELRDIVKRQEYKDDETAQDIIKNTKIGNEDIVGWMPVAPEIDYTISWKQNIYCFDSIVYSLLRKKDYLLLNYEEHGQGTGYKQHKILDKISDLLPYPLKLIDEQSDLLTIIQTLWTTNCDELGGYHFEFKFAELIEYSTIADELEHYTKDIIPLLEGKHDALLDLINKYVNGKSNNELEKKYIEENHPTFYNHLLKVVGEINVAKAYVQSLKASQQLFDTNKAQWIAGQTQIINQKRAPLTQRKTVLEAKPGVLQMFNGKINNPALEEDVKELASIYGTIAQLDEWEKTMVDMAKGIKNTTNKNGKKNKKSVTPAPWIKVREPYYRYMNL